MAVNSCKEILRYSMAQLRVGFPFVQGQDVYISVLPDEGTADYEPHLTLLSFLEVHSPFKTQMCSDDLLNCQDCVDLQKENADAHSSCAVDIDIDKGNTEVPKTSEELIGSLTTEGVATNMQRVLRRQISLHLGGKFMQLLVDHGLMLLKLTSKDKSGTEKVHETPNNKWRKYKRSASFDSRKIVLLFSVLSIIGTMILIYLTLRVKQIGDGSAPV